MGFEKLLEISFVDFVCHSEITSGIKSFLLQKEAVVAVEVTLRARRFRHDVESLGDSRSRHQFSPLNCTGSGKGFES